LSITVVRIYSLPSCTLIHSIEVENPEFVLLSGKPLPIYIIYSKKLKKLLTYGVNGHFIGSIDMEDKPQYPLIYTSKHFRDYFIYSNKGAFIIRSLPYLEVFNIVNLNSNKNLSKLDKSKYFEASINISCCFLIKSFKEALKET